jgi:hypothetical protein
MRPGYAGSLLTIILLTGFLPGFTDAKDYTISAGAGYGGSIFPSGLTEVQAGDTPLFSIVPAQGFKINVVVVDGSPVGSIPIYAFPPVTYDHMIYARFIRITGSLSVESNPPGAKVYVDDEYAGITPNKGGLVIENVPVGDHTLRFVLKGYDTVSVYATVEEGQQTMVPIVVFNPVITPTTTVTTTIPTTTVPTTTIPINTPTTTVPSTTIFTTPVPTTAVVTTMPTMTVPTTADATSIPTTVVTTSVPTTTVPTIVPSTSVLTSTPTTVPVTVPTTTVATTATTTMTTIPTAVPTRNPPAGSLDISSIPSGADVFLDDALKGATPLLIANLNPGTCTLRVKSAGYAVWEEKVIVTSGQNTLVHVTLIPAPTDSPAPEGTGGLFVVSEPGASVFIDGEEWGKSNEVIEGVPNGVQSVVLVRNGYIPENVMVNIEGATVTVTSKILLKQDIGTAPTTEIPLTAVPTTGEPNPPGQAFGGIFMYSVPFGGSVYLDGKYLGMTPYLFISVPSGVHTLKVTLPGYHDAYRSVTVAPGDISMTLLMMNPDFGAFKSVFSSKF